MYIYIYRERERYSGRAAAGRALDPKSRLWLTAVLLIKNPEISIESLEES